MTKDKDSGNVAVQRSVGAGESAGALRSALKLAALKFDLVPKHGRGRAYAPRVNPRKWPMLTKHRFRVKVKSCDGTRETERELAGRMNWLRNRIAEARAPAPSTSTTELQRDVANLGGKS